MFWPWRIRSMARKRHTAEEIVAKLRQVDVLMAQGGLVTDAIQAIGVTEVPDVLLPSRPNPVATIRCRPWRAPCLEPRHRGLRSEDRKVEPGDGAALRARAPLPQDGGADVRAQP